MASSGILRVCVVWILRSERALLALLNRVDEAQSDAAKINLYTVSPSYLFCMELVLQANTQDLVHPATVRPGMDHMLVPVTPPSHLAQLEILMLPEVLKGNKAAGTIKDAPSTDLRRSVSTKGQRWSHISRTTSTIL